MLDWMNRVMFQLCGSRERSQPENHVKISRAALPESQAQRASGRRADTHARGSGRACFDRGNGHIQVTGRDAQGRKQYVYHPRWEVLRNQKKFERMVPFGESLPDLRSRLDADLRRRQLQREKVLALVIKLLEETLIRVGNIQYTQHNGSYGLTTLCDHHADINGASVHFEFRGKSGVEREVDLRDRRLARLVKECQELPGQRLFQYLDEDGQPQSVDSSDVNSYLKQITRADITAKDFRTWGGTVTALRLFHELGPCEQEKQLKRNVCATIKKVARTLGNAPHGVSQLLRTSRGARRLQRSNAVSPCSGRAAASPGTTTTSRSRSGRYCTSSVTRSRPVPAFDTLPASGRHPAGVQYQSCSGLAAAG